MATLAIQISIYDFFNVLNSWKSLNKQALTDETHF